MAGTIISTKSYEEIEVDGDTKLSFSKFLEGKSEKKVNLERVLGIGGEGIVLSHKMDTRENHYKATKNWFGKNKAGCIEKKEKDVALKFVQFDKNDEEDFLGPEIKDKYGYDGGVNEKGKFVSSQYFKRLLKLGDFIAATADLRGYCRPNIDFGISEIHQKYYYVIGQVISKLFNTFYLLL